MLEMLGSARTKKAPFCTLLIVAVIALAAATVTAMATAAESNTKARADHDISTYLEDPLVEGNSHFSSERIATMRDWRMEIRASAGVGDDLEGNYAVAMASSEDLEDSICLLSAPPTGSVVGGLGMACQAWSVAEEHGLYIVISDTDGYHVAAFVPGAQQATLEANAEANDHDGVGLNRVDRDGAMVEATGTWDADIMDRRDAQVKGTTHELVVSRLDAEPVRIDVLGPQADD